MGPPSLEDSVWEMSSQGPIETEGTIMRRLLSLMSTVSLMFFLLAGPAAAEAMAGPQVPLATPQTDTSPTQGPPKDDPTKDEPQAQTASVTAPAFAAGTCDAPGSVVATETAAYSWTISGPESARVYQAVAKTGYLLTGQTSFTFDLSQLESQSADVEDECYVAYSEDAPVEVLGAGAVAPVAAPAPAAASPALASTGADRMVPMGIFGLIALALGAGLAAAAHRVARD